jgi:hypothetical protein
MTGTAVLTMLVERILPGARLAAGLAGELSLLRVRTLVTLAIPVPSERLFADSALELLDAKVRLAMTLKVGLGC